MKLKNSIFIIVLSVLTIIPSLYSEVSFLQIKGLHTSIRPEKSYLSPVHGFIWWSADHINKLYRYGVDDHKTIQLIRKLFYLNPHDNITFDTTKIPSNIASYFSAQTIGTILRALESADTDIESVQQAKNTLRQTLKDELTKNMPEEIRQKIKTYGSLTTQVKQDRKELLTLTNTKKLKESQSNQFKKNKKSLEQKTPQDTHKITETDQKITAIEEEIREITHAIQEKQVSIAAMQTTLREITHTIFPPDAVDTIVNLIFDAYQESLPGEEQRYISYTVHNILLGFLWRKATTKQDFLDYFSTVGADILSNPEIISNPEAQKKWLVQAYLPEEIRNYGSFFSAMEMSAEKKEAVSYEFEQLAVYTYANKLYEKQTFPPQAAGGDPTYQGIQFADCGETSLRNFFNNILYNSTTLIFDFDLLERSFGADAIHPKLKQFYHSPLSSVGNINSTQTLNAWAAVVSGLNIEGPEPIAYRTSEVCEIDAGISNMLRVINRLIGVTTFKELVEKLNAAGLHITVENRSRNNFGEVHFTIGNWEKFVWHFETNHFYITIQELTKIENPNIPIVMVRLMLLISNLYDTGKNNELFNIIMLYANNMYNKFLIDRIQANNFPSPYILHVYLSFNNLMDHQEKLEFIKKILDNDVLGGLPNNLSIDALIINIIKKLPTDFYYINEIMKILSENLKKLRKSKPLSTYFQDHLDMIAQKYRE